MNCAGPNTEPCGTPHDKVLDVDCSLLIINADGLSAVGQVWL